MTHCCITLTRYWPWWIVVGWLIGYELYALLFHKQTLSQQVWKATKHWKWLPWVTIPLVVVLVGHFWFGWWAPHSEISPVWNDYYYNDY